MKLEKNIHEMYSVHKKLKFSNRFSIKPVVGKYHYIYSNSKGRCSLISIPDMWGDGKTRWEICGGGLTNTQERYPSKKKAEKRIEELLGEKIND